MRFEPRLHIDAETAGLIESTTMPLLESPTVIVTDAYPFALAAEIVGDEVRVRAATGDELTAFLTVGDAPNPDDFEWPGDPGLPTGREIEWQETLKGDVRLDLACHLWSGEVIVNSGHGTSSPFFVHERAAHAWVFSTALTVPEPDIFKLQVVPYACISRFVPALISRGRDRVHATEQILSFAYEKRPPSCVVAEIAHNPVFLIAGIACNLVRFSGAVQRGGTPVF
jgi:hypothetical protein